MTTSFEKRIDEISARVGLAPPGQRKITLEKGCQCRMCVPVPLTEPEQRFVDMVQATFPGAEMVERHDGPPTLVRVTIEGIGHGFVLRNGIVREVTQATKMFLGKTDEQARAMVRANNWTAAIVPYHANNREALGLPVEKFQCPRCGAADATADGCAVCGGGPNG